MWLNVMVSGSKNVKNVKLELSEALLQIPALDR